MAPPPPRSTRPHTTFPTPSSSPVSARADQAMPRTPAHRAARIRRASATLCVGVGSVALQPFDLPVRPLHDAGRRIRIFSAELAQRDACVLFPVERAERHAELEQIFRRLPAVRVILENFGEGPPRARKNVVEG